MTAWDKCNKYRKLPYYHDSSILIYTVHIIFEPITVLSGVRFVRYDHVCDRWILWGWSICLKREITELTSDIKLNDFLVNKADDSF